MKQNSANFIKKLPWKIKLMLSGAIAIFLAFLLFSLMEYHMVSKWMMNREESNVKKTLADIATFYKQNEDTLTEKDIKSSGLFLKKMNTKDQMIRVYDQSGAIIISDKNVSFSVLEPNPGFSQRVERVYFEDKDLLVARYPLNVKYFTGTIEVIRQLKSYHEMMKNLAWGMTVFGMAAILLSALSGYVLASQLLRPVRALANTMKRIKENGFHERMEASSQKDELSDLINVFNEMMDNLEKSFTQQKQFVEDASHELRTPVSILEGHVSLLNRWGKKDPAILEESLGASLQEINRLKKIINDLLTLTRVENQWVTTVTKADVYEIIIRLVKNLELLHPDYVLVLDLDKQIPHAAISEQHLEQILIILIDNAIKYSPENKTIEITVKHMENHICFTVRDHGIGIPSEQISNVFNRFYRVDKARSRESGGTGLGLSIAKQIIDKYHGSIVIESKEGVGTKVTLIIPT
ncbi:ATP-binding protein [Neobacillus sp. LXY-1]|uniref:sensor histidine kinase n=1 Tax=Neobacillus sp. LXY-1 TaxID=3379133 RepID=UPI003EE19E8F